MTATRSAWTGHQEEMLREKYPHYKTSALVTILCHPVSSIFNKAKSLGLHKTAEFLASPEAGIFVKNDVRGIGTRFIKGQAAWNKGAAFDCPGSRPTQFKKGGGCNNCLPVGSHVERGDGYGRTKVAEPNVWVLDHHLAWVKAGNELPVYPKVLGFKDGNIKNIDPNNLVILSKKEIMKKNSVQALPTELRKAIHAYGVMTRMMNNG